MIDLIDAVRPMFYKLAGAYVKSKISSVDANFKPNHPLIVKGGGQITIGKNFRSLGPCYLNANNGSIKIGDNCFLNRNVHVDAYGGEIEIGDDCLVGPNSILRAANHGMVAGELIRNQPHVFGKVKIGNDVWVSANCVILGVELASHCVVGAGAVVTRSVKAFEVVGGVPARPIGRRE